MGPLVCNCDTEGIKLKLINYAICIPSRMAMAINIV
jgi:hypothetical protein